MDKLIGWVISFSAVVVFIYLAGEYRLGWVEIFGAAMIYILTVVVLYLIGVFRTGQRDTFLVRDLFRQRMVLVSGNIKMPEALMIMLRIRYLSIKDSKRPIKLLFDSDGGCSVACRMVLNGIKASRAPVDGIVISKAFSSAALMLQGCRNRYALPYSMVMVHDASFPFTVEMEEESALISYRDCDNFEREIREQVDGVREGIEREGAFSRIFLEKTIGMTDEKYAEIKDKYLNPEEALKYNLIDKIVTTY